MEHNGFVRRRAYAPAYSTSALNVAINRGPIPAPFSYKTPELIRQEQLQSGSADLPGPSDQFVIEQQVAGLPVQQPPQKADTSDNEDDFYDSLGRLDTGETGLLQEEIGQTAPTPLPIAIPVSDFQFDQYTPQTSGTPDLQQDGAFSLTSNPMYDERVIPISATPLLPSELNFTPSASDPPEASAHQYFVPSSSGVNQVAVLGRDVPSSALSGVSPHVSPYANSFMTNTYDNAAIPLSLVEASRLAATSAQDLNEGVGHVAQMIDLFEKSKDGAEPSTPLTLRRSTRIRRSPDRYENQMSGKKVTYSARNRANFKRTRNKR